MKFFPKPLYTVLVSSFLLAAAPAAQAQVTINMNRPAWGPAAPATAQYYYLPEVDGYYDLRAQQYLVQRDGRWQRLAQLNGYNPNSWHPVVVDYVGAEPWTRHDEYRRRYPASLPPGQRKRLENGKGLPPGQAKKYYGKSGRDYDNDRQDHRYEDHDQNRRRDYNDREDDHDERGKKDKGYKNKDYKDKGDKGDKGHGKDHDRD